VSIVARTLGALGTTIQVPRDERYVVTEQELDTRVTVLLGGRAAEELALGEISTGAHDDLGRATAIVRDMVTKLGMSKRLGMATLARSVGAPMLGVAQEERLCSESTAREIDEEVRERIADGYRRAKELLALRRDALTASAEALVARETLSGEELAGIAGMATGEAIELVRANGVVDQG
jgi:cell division protease FtsH